MMLQQIINRDFQGPGETFGGGAAGGIAAGGLGMLSGIYDTTVASRDRKREIEARKQEAELAYQRSVADWHRQNAYNTPEEQMKRFGAAGLNPHLIYGQGSAGLASPVNKYQPPEIQMQGVSPPYGSAVQSVLPTLMAVGTWMQNMRLSENRINQSEQLVEFLQSKYPHEIRKFDQIEALMPYQRDIQETRMYQSRSEVARLLEEFEHLYGRELDVGAPYERRGPGQQGMRGLERMLKAQQARKTGLEADWLSPTRVFGMVNAILGRTFKVGSRVVPRAGGKAVPSTEKGMLRGKVKKGKMRFDEKGRRIY